MIWRVYQIGQLGYTSFRWRSILTVVMNVHIHLLNIHITLSLLLIASTKFSDFKTFKYKCINFNNFSEYTHLT